MNYDIECFLVHDKKIRIEALQWRANAELESNKEM